MTDTIHLWPRRKSKLTDKQRAEIRVAFRKSDKSVGAKLLLAASYKVSLSTIERTVLYA